MSKYMDDCFALHTDLYQINMAEAYREDNIHTKNAVFELYFRELFGNGYAIFAGLERIIEYLQTFHFSESDLDYLKGLGYQEDYVDFLRTIRFTGTVRSMKEGEVVFGNEPLLRISTVCRSTTYREGLIKYRELSNSYCNQSFSNQTSRG